MRMLWHGVVALAVMADTVTSFHVVVPSAFAPARTTPRLRPTTPRMQMGFSTGVSATTKLILPTCHRVNNAVS